MYNSIDFSLRLQMQIFIWQLFPNELNESKRDACLLDPGIHILIDDIPMGDMDLWLLPNAAAEVQSRQSECCDMLAK